MVHTYVMLVCYSACLFGICFMEEKHNICCGVWLTIIYSMLSSPGVRREEFEQRLVAEMSTKLEAAREEIKQEVAAKVSSRDQVVAFCWTWCAM